MAVKSKKKLIERIVVFAVALIVAALLVFFLKDIFIPFIKAQANKDYDTAKEILSTHPWRGYATVSLVEGLQMVVIFIPAEFIQLTSGMSYPWWLAIILCDIGVVIGATLIYLLVNIFKFEGDILDRGSRIREFEKKTKVNNTIFFMYLLFIMPVIPFGAICYFGSGRKIPYWKYIIVCATGVIPSICTSILMGTAIKYFIAAQLPLWALVLIIIGAAVFLFVLLAFVIKKFFFKQSMGTPDSFLYSWSIKLGFKLLKLRNKVRVIGKEKLVGIDGPFLVLSSHHSFLDPYAISAIYPKERYAYVFNKYYLRIPIWGKMLLGAGLIPKRMFTPDFECASKIVRTIKNGFPVAIFPEGRLSTDGGASSIDDTSAKLALLCKVPVVLVQVRKGYFNKPKWRPTRFKGKLDVEIMDVLWYDTFKDMPVEEIHSRIVKALSFNDFDDETVSYKKKNLAKGLENILYMCPHCHSLHSNVTKGRTITCSSCGKTYHIKPNYQFEESDIKNIHDYYKLIKEIELKEIDKLVFDIEVDTVIFSKDMKKKTKDHGIFHFDSNKISYKSSGKDIYFEYETKKIEGIAYSVNEEFEMYHEGQLHYFYPVKDRWICARIALLQELLREKEYGKQKQ